jgi:hypothetical protein
MAIGVDLAHFRIFGFVVLRRAFEPSPLQEEVDRAMRDGVGSFHAGVGGGEVKGHYAPMMTARTKFSLSLLDLFEPQAALLLGGPVLPVRAKGVRYVGGTPWHTDSRHAVASVGFAAYLDPLDAESGALCVLPGSHRPDFGEATLTYLTSPGASATVSRLPGYAIASEPGDVIAFDEHLFHGSAGGKSRRQWRVDYVRNPVGSSQEDSVRSYFANIFPPDWDGGYDVDQYPSYGPDWLASGRPAVARLRELGVYELADAQEAFVRSRSRAREVT